MDLAGLGLGPGLYRLRAVLPANNDFNVFGVWVEGFQTYTFSSSFGSLNTFTGPAPDLTPLDPARMYPVFERGCEYTASNFDLDVNSRPASLALTTALGELFPLTGTNNNVHAEDTIDPAPGAAAPASREVDYGIHTLESVLSPNSVENNLVTLRFADFQGWVDAGGAARIPALRDSIAALLPADSVWAREDVPARFHYSADPRIGDIVIVAERERTIVTSSRLPARDGFTHGWDNEVIEMGAIFLARGPGIAAGQRIEPFESVHVYPFLTHLLGLTPNPEIDGDLSVLAPILTK